MKKATLFKQILCFVLSCLFVLQLGVPSAFANTTQNGNESVTSVISEDKNYEALIDGILEKNDTYPNENGLWVNTSSRGYFLKMVTNLSDQEYTINEDGYLVQETVNYETFNTYDEKLKELIEGSKTIIVALSSTYNAYNEALNSATSKKDMFDIRMMIVILLFSIMHIMPSIKIIMFMKMKMNMMRNIIILMKN